MLYIFYHNFKHLKYFKNTYNKLHMLKVHHFFLQLLAYVYTHDTITTVKTVDTFIISKVFIVSLCNPALPPSPPSNNH